MKNSNTQQKPFALSSKFSFLKKRLTVVVLVILLAGTGVGIWFLVASRQNSTLMETEVRENSTQTPGEIRNEAMSSAQTLANSGKVSEAAVLYDQAVSQAKDTYDKSILLSSKASLYLNDGKNDEALKTAKEAEAIHPTAVCAYLIAQIYEKLGDYEKAVEYYKKAIPLVDKTQPLADEDITYYENKIKILSGELK